MKNSVALLALLAALLCAPITKAYAVPVDGTLSVETPISSADHPSDDSTAVKGSLTCHLSKLWTLSGQAQYSFGDRDFIRSVVQNEDKVRGTLAYNLTRDLSLYTAYERRFSLDRDRWLVGATLKFRVSK